MHQHAGINENATCSFRGFAAIAPPPLPNRNPNIPLHQTNSQYGGVFPLELSSVMIRPDSRWKIGELNPREVKRKTLGGPSGNNGSAPPPPPTTHPMLPRPPPRGSGSETTLPLLSEHRTSPCLIGSDCIITRWE